MAIFWNFSRHTDQDCEILYTFVFCFINHSDMINTSLSPATFSFCALLKSTIKYPGTFESWKKIIITENKRKINSIFYCVKATNFLLVYWKAYFCHMLFLFVLCWNQRSNTQVHYFSEYCHFMFVNDFSCFWKILFTILICMPAKAGIQELAWNIIKIIRFKSDSLWSTQDGKSSYLFSWRVWRISFIVRIATSLSCSVIKMSPFIIIANQNPLRIFQRSV